MRGYLPHRFRALFSALPIVLVLAVCACAPVGSPSADTQLGPFRYEKFEFLALPTDAPKYFVEDLRTSPRVIYGFDLRMGLTPSDYVRSGLDTIFAGFAGTNKDDVRELRFSLRDFRLEKDQSRQPPDLICKIEMDVVFVVNGQIKYRTTTKTQEVESLSSPNYKMSSFVLPVVQETLDASFYKTLKKIYYDPKLLAALKQNPLVVAQTQPVLPQQSITQTQTVASPQPMPAAKPKIDDHADDVAVIIGNRGYHSRNKGVPDVEFAHNDAERMKRFVVETLGYREGNVILVKDATQADMTSLFGNEKIPRGRLFSWLKPERSRIFVYYSGHGAPSLVDGKGYLLPVDADPNLVELNGYGLELLYRNLAQLPARQMTVVLDSCFSGGSQAGLVLANASPAMLKVVDVKAVLPKAVIFSAAGEAEIASWDREAQLGLFTRQFLEAAGGKADQDGFGNGDGEVTVAELRSYLTEQVPYLARRLYLREQHPQVVGRDEQVIARVQ